MGRRSQLRAYWGVAVAAPAARATLSLVNIPVRSNLQNLAFDEYQSWRPSVEARDLPVRVVYIDDESIRCEMRDLTVMFCERRGGVVRRLALSKDSTLALWDEPVAACAVVRRNEAGERFGAETVPVHAGVIYAV